MSNNMSDNYQEVPAMCPDCSPNKGNSKTLFLELKNKKNTTVPPCSPITSTKEDIKKSSANRGDPGGDEEKKMYIDKTIETKGGTGEHFNLALMLLPFWNLLVCFWNCAIDLNPPWSQGFEKRITIPELSPSDLDWLIRAMGHTYNAMPDGALKAAALPEYKEFLEMSKIHNWPEMYRRKTLYIEKGPEWQAVIADQGYELTKTVRAHSREQAEKLLRASGVERVKRWVFLRCSGSDELEIVDSRAS